MATEERRRNPCFEDDGVANASEEEREEDDSSEDFEFSFAVRSPVDLPIVTADELFSGGRILPAYPVFGRLQDPAAEGEELRIPLGRLSIDDAWSARPRAGEQEEREAAGEPSASAPQSPDRRCQKSASTGSTGRARRWRLRDLVGRSRSDGKEKFSFIEAEGRRSSVSLPPAEKKEKVGAAGDRGASKAKGAAAGQRVREMDVVAAHRLYYGAGKGSGERGTTRRSFLPYRRDLVGLFAPVSRLSW